MDYCERGRRDGRRRGAAVRALAILGLLCGGTPALAATRYVSPTGTDAPSGGAQAAPFRTIGYGLARTASGDTLVVLDGVYADIPNFINDGRHSVADGTPGAYTTIRAANPFGVRIWNVGATNYYDSPLRIRGNYVHVDGFVFDLRDTANTPLVGELAGSYNKVTRSIFRRQGAVDQYGGWLHVDGHHHLVEDVGGVGAARYGFATGGPTADTHHIIFRRVVGRFDFSPSSQPKATFSAYGNDSGWGVHHILYQNCIAVDGQRGPATGQAHYGAWYFPKNLDEGQLVGSIALNNSVAYAGLFLQELQGRNTRISHTVSWGATDAAGIRWNGTGSMSIATVTVGANASALYNNNSTTQATLRQSLFVGNGQLLQGSGGFSEFSGSAFVPPLRQTTCRPDRIVPLGRRTRTWLDTERRLGTGR
ncbi:hypothetical protein [Tahibacter amnicola]|uniref:Uncharacterized protein n=1 Tax=Tahibacter amnicola TaxID=2976241 RepID=A0ABY6BLL5_9GAMM|nr:hypothetical protein [Tahibacter amnicola]UXI70333.1 hypothetical protein N4264_12060 [Tahibacter amnicola]